MPRSPARLASLGSVCTLVAALTAPAHADESPAAKAAGPVAFSLTISGGVSLGAHEAGFLYYLTEVVKRNPQVFHLVTVTGASAGSMNGRSTTLEGWSPPIDDPPTTLFCKTWMPVG